MAVKEMNERKMQSKVTLANIELKEDGQSSDVLHIRAYALAFGNVDSWGDVIAEGAVDAFLKSEDFSRMALCYQFLSRETGISGNFVGRIKGAKCPFDLQFLTWDFS